MENIVPNNFPPFLLKNFDPNIHKSKKDLIGLVQAEIDLFWEGRPMAVNSEQRFSDAVSCLKKLKGLR